jgi:hypothetical protein
MGNTRSAPRSVRGAAALPPEQRASLARMGAYALHGQYDSKALTRGAREAKRQRWAQQVDPTGELARRDPAELERRIKSLQALEMEKVRFAKLQKAGLRKAEETRQLARQVAQQEAQQEVIPAEIPAEIPLVGADPEPGEVETALAKLALLTTLETAS